MCIFNTPVVEVGGTKIFSGRTEDGNQVVVYRNYVSVEFASGGGRQNAEQLKKRQKELKDKQRSDVTPAMILPFPIVAGTDVQLLDLSKNKEFFGDLKKCYPTLVSTRRSKSRASRSARGAKLEVHEVGSYNVDALLGEHYGEGFGFIIAAFHNNDEKHPLGYVHSLVDNQLFIPTRHHHGASVEQVSHWDHEIFTMGVSSSACGGGAGESPQEASSRLAAKSSASYRVAPGALTPAAVLDRLPLRCSTQGPLRLLSKQGSLPNGDLTFQLA